MDMKLAVEKTVILAYGTNQNSWKVTEGEPDIELRPWWQNILVSKLIYRAEI